MNMLKVTWQPVYSGGTTQHLRRQGTVQQQRYEHRRFERDHSLPRI